MALVKDRARINVRGGGLLKVRQIHPAPSDTWTDVGYLTKTDIDDTREMVESRDERGILIDWVEGAAAPMIKSVLKQTSIDEINLMKNADAIYYEVYYYCKLANGRFQELDAPIGKIKPGLILSFASATERTMEIEIHFLPVTPETSITRAPTGYNLDPAVNRHYVIVENAAALNAPTDTASSLKTAVW